MKRRFLLEILIVALLLSFASAQDAASFEKRITVKKLSNGLTVIVCERPEAPVFSFYTFVNAGSVQDPYAKTGLAHMFEHMAFKVQTRLVLQICGRKSSSQESRESVRGLSRRARPNGRTRRAEACPT